jgi:tetratricopeptide (TPR) repeat protein
MHDVLSRFPEVEQLYAEGRYLTAWHVLGKPSAAELRTLAGTDACLLGARLARQWGNALLSVRLFVRAYGEAPDHGEARYGRADLLLSHRGPLRALEFLDRAPTIELTPRQHAHLLCLRARALGQLRDFARASAALDEAQSLAPADRWISVSRAALIWARERRDEAVEHLRALLAGGTTWHRPAVQLLATYLTDLDRAEEALQLLRDADARLECGSVAAQILLLAVQAGDVDLAYAAAARTLALQPLATRHVRAWQASELSRLHLNRSERDAALEHARPAATVAPFWTETVARLERASEAPPMRILPVPAVRQRHETCAPATLAALTAACGHPVEQERIAAAICHGGTYAEQERTWLEAQGFCVREFRVTLACAAALIEHGIPFALETRWFETGHLQAVVGHDPATDHLVIREPSTGLLRYMDSSLLDEGRNASGPRGIVIAAPGQSLPPLELPEAEGYDAYHAMAVALRRHDRVAAEAARARLGASAEWTRLAMLADWHLRSDDGDLPGVLRAIDALRAAFPEDSWLAWRRLEASHGLEPLAAREAAVRTALKARVHPYFHLAYARLLSMDARQRAQAQRHLVRAERQQPLGRGVLVLQAQFAERDGDAALAYERFRFASLLAPADEELAWDTVRSAFLVQRSGEALDWLRERDEQSRPRSRCPAITRYDALSWLGRMAEAEALLAELRREYPDDPVVEMRFARSVLWTGRHAEAVAVLERFRTSAHGSVIARLLAEAHEFAGANESAVAVLRQRLAIEPAALDLHQHLCRLLADQHGLPAVSAHLAEARTAHPHAVGLYELSVNWLKESEPQQAVALLRSLLAMHPDNAWAWRELGFLLLRLDARDAAREAAAHAAACEPTATGTYQLLGELWARDRANERALDSWWCATERDAYAAYARSRLVDLALSPEARLTTLTRQIDALSRLPHGGDPLLQWLDDALRSLPARVIADLLETREAAFEHFWQWHVALARALGFLDEQAALARARRVVERWPHLARAWLELARAQSSARDPEARASARRALELAPDWDDAAQLIADIDVDAGELEAAQALLRARIARNPRNAANLGLLAQLLRRQQQAASAVEALVRALELQADYPWAWSQLEALDRGRCVTLALELAQRHPGSADAWYRLALVSTDEHRERALFACERCLQLAPEHLDALELKAYLLTQLGRVEEALALCGEHRWNGGVPPRLSSRAAWTLLACGRHAEAFELLRAAELQHPDDAGLQWTLLEVAQQLERRDAFKKALGALTRLQPLNARVVRELARQAEEQGHHDAELAERRRLVELEPSSLDAWIGLVRCCIRSKLWDEAAKANELAWRRCPSPWLLVVTIEAAYGRGDAATAERAFDQLCRDPHATAAMMADALRAAPRLSVLLQRIVKLLDEPPVSDAAAETLVEHWFADVDASFEGLAARLATPAATPFVRAVVGLYLARLAELLHKHKLLRKIGRHRDALRRDTSVWGKVGYALAFLNRDRELAAWGHDWREHALAEGWMLYNVAGALAAVGQRSEAMRVRQHALNCCADMRGEHAAWLALDHLIIESGEPIAGLEAIAGQAPPTRASGPDSEIGKLPRSLLRIMRHPEPRRALPQLAVHWPCASPGVRRAYLGPIRDRLLRAYGPIARWLWRLWYTHPVQQLLR